MVVVDVSFFVEFFFEFGVFVVRNDIVGMEVGFVYCVDEYCVGEKNVMVSYRKFERGSRGEY